MRIIVNRRRIKAVRRACMARHFVATGNSHAAEKFYRRKDVTCVIFTTLDDEPDFPLNFKAT